MTEKRLPSFNDFSPGIFPDIRKPLRAVRTGGGNLNKIIAAVSALNDWSVTNKRAKNVLITLHNTGLFDRINHSLTALGVSIENAASAQEAASLFCKHILETKNGLILIDAIRRLNKRSEPVRKDSLKAELERLGITNLATATTDHTTLRNWMVNADVLRMTGRDYSVDDGVLKRLIGVSSEEGAQLEELEIPQRIFILILRRLAITEGGNWLPTRRLLSECLRDYPRLFDEDQMRKKVLEPLQKAGWVATSNLTSGRGAKSGQVRAEAKLLNIPVKYVVPTFDTAVPPDLRSKIDTPLTKIKEMLDSTSKNERGIALELLVLRMILDLSLIPRGFRKRAKSTGYAEVDVTAEGKNLLFSRWMFQCKAIKQRSKVGTEDVAREVGIAVHAKAHVIAMVTTGGFTRNARDFAREVTSTTHLQFLFLDGQLVREYLQRGPTKLIEYVLRNAGEVMTQKQELLPPEVVGTITPPAASP